MSNYFDIHALEDMDAPRREPVQFDREVGRYLAYYGESGIAWSDLPAGSRRMTWIEANVIKATVESFFPTKRLEIRTLRFRSTGDFICTIE